MNSNIKHALCAGLSALALSLGAIGSANATDGYFMEGVSARDQALGGAGTANPTDSFTTFINPAGLVDVGHQMSGDISLFAPSRGYDASGTSLVAPGSFTSGRDVFAIPSLGYSAPLNADQAVGVSMVGNGGMDTSYAANIPGAMACRGATGVFCAGRTGVDLNQGLISLGYAQRFGNLSIGIAPTMSVQVFSAYGLAGFEGLSSNMTNVTDHSPNYSIGGGVRAGALYHFNDQVNLALTGSTPIWSTPFHEYAGLFAGGGNFDIPAEIGAGLSYKVVPTLALMFDWKHIFYSDVKSIGDQMTPLGFPGAPLLGSGNGQGFGWRDVDVFSLGAEWKYSSALTMRVGYSYNTQPVTAANVMFNILAPGVVTNHVSGGFTYNMNPNSAIDFAVVYAPRTTVSGQEYLPGFGVVNPASNISIHLSELQVTLGYTYHFDVPAPAVIAKY